MNDIIKECINDFIKKEVIMEYNASNNEVIYSDINNILSLLVKFKNELFEDIKIRHDNGEMVSKNEAIIVKTEHDINELINDLKHLI